MARGVDDRLRRLRALRKEEASPSHVEELRKALADRSPLVVAAGAEIAGQRGLVELEPDLAAAFERLINGPAGADKLCLGKIALMQALNKVASDRAEPFLRGIGHQQLEPRWGGAEDAAAALRGEAAFGLVRINHREAINLLAELMADPAPVARAAAARALGYSRAPAALPLLRFKACLGDREPAVTVECLAALAAADPKDAPPFIARFLDSPDEATQEGAAFALGESRREEAFDLLRAHWPKARGNSLRHALLLAISSTRLPKALEFLVEILTTCPQSEARMAIAALAIHRHNQPFAQRIGKTVAARGDAILDEEFRKQFPEACPAGE
jgi:HEAT repeat protein